MQKGGMVCGPWTVRQMVPLRDRRTISRSARMGGGEAVTWFSLGAGTSISPESYDCAVLYLGGDGCAWFQTDAGAHTSVSGKTALVSEKTASVPGKTASHQGSGEETPTGKALRCGDALFVPGGSLCGVMTEGGAVYTEIMLTESAGNIMSGFAEDLPAGSVEEREMFSKAPAAPKGAEASAQTGMHAAEGTRDTGKEWKMNEQVKPGEVLELRSLVEYEEGSIVNCDIVKGNGLRYVLMAFDQGTGLQPHRAPGNAIVTALEGSAVIGYEGAEYELKEGESFRFAKNGLHSVTADRGRFKMSLLLITEE